MSDANYLPERVPKIREGCFGPDDHLPIIEEIRASRADMLFVGMHSPIKETWCERHHQCLEVPVTVGVGGGFDVLAGFTKRATRGLQSPGPRRIWRLLIESRKPRERHLATNNDFICLADQEIVAPRVVRPPARQGHR